MKDPYQVLGVKRDATDDEIKEAYRALVRKYHPDNYSDDNPLKDLANEKMQEVNEAYDEIQKIREGAQKNAKNADAGYNSSSSYNSSSYNSDPRYGEIRRLLNARRFAEAEKKLSQFNEYDCGAEWHYLMSVCLMQRGRVNDAMRELETACMMDPSNAEYQKAKQMFNGQAGGYGSTYYGPAYQRRSTSDEACDCCANLICMDCLCECMGGDLIPCL